MHHFARLFSTLTTLVGSWVVVLLNTKLTTVSTKLVLSKWAETMTNSDPPPLGLRKMKNYEDLCRPLPQV